MTITIGLHVTSARFEEISERRSRNEVKRPALSRHVTVSRPSIRRPQGNKFSKLKQIV